MISLLHNLAHRWWHCKAVQDQGYGSCIASQAAGAHRAPSRSISASVVQVWAPLHGLCHAG